jgi:hypothetical protein
MAFLAPNASIPDDAAHITVLQIAWALVTGPVILIIIARAQKQLDLWRHRLLLDW